LSVRVGYSPLSHSKSTIKQMNSDRCILHIKANTIQEKYRQISKHFANFKIAYAVKANPDERIIEILKQEKSYFETASLSEIIDLLKQKIHPQKIIFSNPVKEISAISQVLEKKITMHSFDSIDELKKYLQVDKNKKAQLLFRISVPNNGSLWPLSDKFGSPKKFWKKIYSFMQSNRLQLAGLTFHVGSQCENDKNWHKAMKLVKQATLLAKKYGLHPYVLNIGGGFPIDLGRKISSIDKIFGIIDSYIQQYKKYNIEFTEFYAEPGRFIVGEAGVLETEIIGIAERDEGKWVFLNCGVFNGMMEVIDGITYPMTFSSNKELEKVTLCGPSCDSMDRLYVAKIPSPKSKDKIFFHGTGAYTTVYSSNFNGFKSPFLKIF